MLTRLRVIYITCPHLSVYMLFKPDRDLGGQLHLSAKRLEGTWVQKHLINILLFYFLFFAFLCVCDFSRVVC